MQKILNKTEDIAFSLLTAWCFLPVIMSIYTVVLDILGMLPSKIEVEEQGLILGIVNYNVVLDRYYLLFHILGIITFSFVLFVVLAGSKQLFSLENIKNKPWYYFLLALLVWATISALNADDLYIALFDNLYLCDSLSSYYIYASVFVCASLIKDNKKRKKITKLFSFVILLCALEMIIQETTQNEYLLHLFPCSKAVVFNNLNHFGYLLCMAAYCFLTLYLYEDKYIYLILFSIIIYSLLMNDTFGSYLATVVVLPICYFIYFLSGKKFAYKKFLPIIVFGFISFLSMLNMLPYANSLGLNVTSLTTDVNAVIENTENVADAGSLRMGLWIDTINKIKSRPIIGYGPQGFTNKNVLVTNTNPHNEFLQIAGYLGIPGILLYLSSLISLCINKFKKIKDVPISVLCTGTVLIVYLASSVFGNPVFNTYPYFWMFFGLTCDDSLFDFKNKEIAFEFNSKTNKNHLFKVISTSLLLCISIGLITNNIVIYKSEIVNEKADLEAMKVAEVKIKQLIKDEKIEYNNIYYLDVNNYDLTFIKPIPYGYGTKIKGNTVEEYNTENKKSFNYDETLDYTNKVIQVIVHSSDDIEIEWVD